LIYGSAHLGGRRFDAYPFIRLSTVLHSFPTSG
jgi:hypothetical protein